MKKIAVVVSGLALLSTSAFATRARMEGLGQNQAQGSFFMRDSRTMFRNASHINDSKNYVSIELGDGNTGAAVNTNRNTDNAPEAEGGFVKDAGKFTYGVWLNHQYSDQNTVLDMQRGIDDDGDGVVEAVFLGQGDRVDLFFGGDAGIQWGVNISHVTQRDELGNDQDTGTAQNGTLGAADYKYWGLNFGMTMGDIEAYLNMDIHEESKGAILQTTLPTSGRGTEAQLTGDFSFQVGFNYSFGDHVAYVEYDRDGHEYTNGDPTDPDNAETSLTQFTLGLSKMMEINEKSRWFWDAMLEIDQIESTTGGIVGDPSFERTDRNLTFTVGFESDVKSWLTLRGAVAQNVIINTRSDSAQTGGVSTPDRGTRFSTTEISTGASIHMGDITIDGVLGLNEGAVNTFGETARFGFGDDMFARTALTYNF